MDEPRAMAAVRNAELNPVRAGLAGRAQDLAVIERQGACHRRAGAQAEGRRAESSVQCPWKSRQLLDLGQMQLDSRFPACAGTGKSAAGAACRE